MTRQDDLDVKPADVEERRRGDLAAAGLQLPHLGVGHGDEVARFGHEVGDARAGHQLDEAAHAVGRSEDGDFRSVFHVTVPWRARAARISGSCPWRSCAPGPTPPSSESLSAPGSAGACRSNRPWSAACLAWAGSTLAAVPPVF